jgi:hypothetical protein
VILNFIAAYGHKVLAIYLKNNLFPIWIVMIKKAAFLVLMVLLLAGADAFALTYNWNAGGGADRSWTTPANWDREAVPTIADEAKIHLVSGTEDGPLVDTETAAALYVRLGGPLGGAELSTLTIVDGGILTVGEWIMAGTDSASSESGVLNMTGGVLNLGMVTPSSGDLNIGHTGSATRGFLYMSGGVIYAPATFYIARNDGTTGEAHLNDGVIYTGALSMASGAGCTASMDITAGTLIIDGDKTATVNGYAGSGLITAYGGTGTLNVDYDVTNPGQTTVTATTEGGTFMYWNSNFGQIALGNIASRDQVCNGSSQITLSTNGNVEISADNSDTARFTESGGDHLYTEYKLEFDGDGLNTTGGETVDFTSYDSFLSSPVTVTHIPGYDEVQVTLSARASNYPGQLANAGDYTATQTLTATWNDP